MSFELRTTFESWVKSLRYSWMGQKSRRMWGAFATVLGDRSVEWARQALLEQFPEFSTSLMGLGLIASSRQMDPGPTETTESIAQRCVKFIAQHQLAGTHLGLLLHLFFTSELRWDGTVLVQQNGTAAYLAQVPDLETIAAALAVVGTPLTTHITVSDLGTNPPIGGIRPLAAGVHPWWHTDGDIDGNSDQYNSRFALLITSPPAAWTNIQTVLTPSTAPTLAEVNRLRRVIKRWKPAKAKLLYIKVVTGGRVLGWPVRQLGPSNGVLGGSSVTWGPDET